MAVKTISTNFVVAQNAALVLHAGKSNQALVRGLTGLSIPTGFDMSTVVVSEMGRRIDLIVPTGGAYQSIDIPTNFVPGDSTQTELYSASLNSTGITDMRFYTKQGCDFAALDLINDDGGKYYIGTMGAPTVGSKNELFTSTTSILPAGSSVFFIAHSAPGLGTNITFVSEATAGGGATATLSAGQWDTFGFEVGDTVLIDYMDGFDPLYAKVATVATTVLTFEVGVGDSADITDSTGIAATQVHGATAVEVSGSTVTCD